MAVLKKQGTVESENLFTIVCIIVSFSVLCFSAVFPGFVEEPGFKDVAAVLFREIMLIVFYALAGAVVGLLMDLGAFYLRVDRDDRKGLTFWGTSVPMVFLPISLLLFIVFAFIGTHGMYWTGVLSLMLRVAIIGGAVGIGLRFFASRRGLGDPIRYIWNTVGMFIVFYILFLLCSRYVESFYQWQNMIGLLLAVSTIGMVACTMLFCLASGNFDLSVGSTVACSGVVAAVVINWVSRFIYSHYNLTEMTSFGSTCVVVTGVLAGIGIGGLVGLINGIVVAKFKINALITTLAMMEIVRGLAYIVSGGNAVGVQDERFFVIGNSEPLQVFAPLFVGLFRGESGVPKWIMNVLEIPAPVGISIICFLVFGFIMRRTTFGRNTLAVGGNEEAARLAGISVDRVKIVIFAAQGLMAGMAGVVLASRMTSGQPMASKGFELQVISSCVLGGVSLTGGVGNMLFVISGLLIMGTVENAMNLKAVPTFWQYVARGAILLGAVLFDRFKQRRQ